MKKIVFGITITTALLLAGFFGGASSDVSGEAFLRTKGGSVITCAGSSVYIEKANPAGYVFLTNTIKAKKDLKNVLSTINYAINDKREKEVRRLEINLKNGSLDTSINFIKIRLEQVEVHKAELELPDRPTNLIKKQLEQAEVQKTELEEKLENPELLDIPTTFIKKQLEQAKLEKNLESVDYWKKRLKGRPTNLIKKQLEQAKEQVKEEIRKTKEEIRKTKERLREAQKEIRKTKEVKTKKYLEEIRKTKKRLKEAKEEKEVKTKKHLEKIRKIKEKNEKKVKEESKEILAVEKEISKLEERLKNVTKENTKETTCNSQGQFVFTELSPDTYYISTTVQWFVGDEKQGGTVTKTIILNEGENKIFINK